MTNGLVVSSLKCQKLYKSVAGLDRNDPKFKSYVMYRNTYNTIKRKAKQRYYTNKLIRFKRDSKKLWSTMKYVIGKSNNKTDVPDVLNVNGSFTSDPQLIANGFCSHFSTIGSVLAKKLPKIKNKSFMSFMPKNVVSNFFLFPTDEQEISNIIMSLDCKH